MFLMAYHAYCIFHGLLPFSPILEVLENGCQIFTHWSGNRSLALPSQVHWLENLHGLSWRRWLKPPCVAVLAGAGLPTSEHEIYEVWVELVAGFVWAIAWVPKDILVDL